MLIRVVVVVVVVIIDGLLTYLRGGLWYYVVFLTVTLVLCCIHLNVTVKRRKTMTTPQVLDINYTLISANSK